jgi:hypothetical protein
MQPQGRYSLRRIEVIGKSLVLLAAMGSLVLPLFAAVLA